MGGFKLGKLTMRSLFSKPATVQYPFEKREPYAAMRGHVEIDIDACILCGMCQRACPASAITVDRKAGNWEINPFMCVQCANCVRECPKKCLSMGLLPTEPSVELTPVAKHKDMPAKPAAGAKAAGAAGAAAKPKPKLTPEQEARVAAARAKKEAAKKAAAVEGMGGAKPAAPAEGAAPSQEATE